MDSNYSSSEIGTVCKDGTAYVMREKVGLWWILRESTVITCLDTVIR